MTNGYKICVDCDIQKPIDNFHKKKSSKDGYNNICKGCKKKKDRLYYEQHSERIKEKSLRIYFESMSNVDFVEAERLRSRERYRKYRDRYALQFKERYHSDPKVREASRISDRKYRENNPDAKRVTESRRRARSVNLDYDFTHSDWLKLKELFGNKCALTGSEDPQIEHFIPISTGHGGTCIGNIIPLSRKLNSLKAMRNPFEWVEDCAIEINPKQWDRLISYLAEINGLSTSEYITFVNWCFENKREPYQAKGMDDSVTLWRLDNGRN